MVVKSDHDLLEIALRLNGTRSELGRYLYSKLYYATRPDAQFNESAVVCFEVPERFSVQRLQIALPNAAWQEAKANGYLRLRVDGLPYSKGCWEVMDLRAVADSHDSVLAKGARRVAH